MAMAQRGWSGPSHSQKLGIVALLFGVYAAAFSIFQLPDIAHALAVVPVIVAAFWFEVRGGLLAALAAVLVVLALNVLRSGPDALLPSVLVQRLFGHIVLVVTGPLVGWLAHRERVRNNLLARLSAAGERRIQEQTLLAAAGHALSASLDTPQVLYTVVEQFARATGAPLSSLLDYQLPPERVTVAVVYRDTAAAVATGLAVALRAGATWRLEERPVVRAALLAQEPRTVDDATAAEADREVLRALGCHTLLAVPLVAQGMPIGLVELYAAQPGAFTPDHLRLCTALAAQAAIAIENARLYQHTAAQARALAKRSIHLMLLNDLSRQLTAIRTPITLYDSAVAAIHHTFGYPTVDLWVIDENAGVLVLQASSTQGVTAGQARQALDAGLPGWVAQQDQSALVPDVAADPRCVPGADMPEGAALCVPIRHHDRTIGVVHVQSRQTYAFDEQDARALEVLADQVAVVLESAALLEDLRETNHLLEDSITRLEEANRLKSVFLANMSHELRTPLSAIVGYIELMMTGAYGALTPQQSDRLERVLANARTLLTLINDVLDFSRIIAGGLALYPHPMDLPDVIARAIQTVEPQARAKGLDFTWELQHPLPRVLGDAQRIQQVLVNLLVNAIKFTPEGSVRVRCWRWAADEPGLPAATVLPAGELAAVSVRDTGIGISAADLPYIFEEFRQADSSATRQYGGAGLGLAICRRLVELHGGAIWAESEPAAGSTFTFVLPALVPALARGQARPEAQAEPAQAEPAQAEPAQAEPAQTEPAQTEPAQAEPVQTEPAP